MRRHPLTRAAGAVAAALAFAGVATPDVTAAAPRRVAVQEPATDGLTVTTRATYRFDPAVPAVDVEVQLTLVNDTPPVTEGGVVSSAYWDGYGVVAADEATGLRATSSDGRPLSLQPEPLEGDLPYQYVGVDLGRRLFHRDSMTLTVHWSIPTTAPRSGGTTRVNAASASFSAFVVGGDPGRTTIQVAVPAGFETVLDGGDDMDEQELGGQVVYTADAIEAPELFFVDVTSRDDDALLRERVDLDPGAVDVRAWPGDQEWADFVGEQVADGVPALEEVTGLRWPTDDTVEVMESITPYLYGYAGWYQPVENLIEVGDELDQHVILHELSHVWFNDDLFSSRWVLEGLAEVVSARVEDELGGDPPAADMPAADAPGHQPLQSWSEAAPQDDGTEDAEQYGYDASYAVVHAIAEEIGDHGLREVLQAADQRRTPYPGEDRTEELTRAPSWRQFLDWVEIVGGAEEAEELFRKRVVDGPMLTELLARRDSRKAYLGIVETGGAWAPPATLRRAMRDWDFGDADRLMPKVREVLEARAELRTSTRRAGLPEPRDLERLYEGSEAGPVEVRREVEEATRAAAAYRRAEEAADGGGPLAIVGGLLSSADDDLRDARTAFLEGDSKAAVTAAEDARDAAGQEAVQGGLLLAGGLVLVLALTTGGALAVGRRRRDDWGPSGAA